MSYVSSYYHCVFSTKERRPLIPPDLRERLWPFLGGIARQNQMKAIEVGGMPDHVHILLSLPSTIPIAKALQLIKGGSSKWVHDTFPEHRLFRWQAKYGAFGVSVSLFVCAQIGLRCKHTSALLVSPHSCYFFSARPIRFCFQKILLRSSPLVHSAHDILPA